MDQKDKPIADTGSKEKPKPKNLVPMFAMYAYASTGEIALVLLGLIFSLLCGGILPITGILFGDGTYSLSPINSWKSMEDKITKLAVQIFIVGGIALVLQFVTYYFWALLGTKISYRMRQLYFTKLLEKDVTWFDLNKPQELPTKIATQCTSFNKGVGDKAGLIFMAFSSGISGLTLAFIRGWKLMLMIIGMSPLMVAAFGMMGSIMGKMTSAQHESYAKSGGYSEEAISYIKTVASFNGQKNEIKRYCNSLAPSRDSTIKWLSLLGVSNALITLVMDVVIMATFFIGSYLIQYGWYNSSTNEPYNAGDIMAIYTCGIMGIMMFAFIGPNMQHVYEARTAATEMFSIINDKKHISIKGGNVQIPAEQFKGTITFKDVVFAYPSRSEVKRLNNFNYEFQSGKTTAICGETGSGKSTLIQLIERFYEPNSGDVTVDGYSLKNIDLIWLRKNIGYVGQEPVLFNTSIKDNIKYGKEDASMEEIEEACKKANCYNFIMKLENKFETIVGRDGSKMSGGQKQRIAIARALIKSPKILLLDEATSALDKKNEEIVQRSLKQISKDMTVVIVAHRLSTIEAADEIILLHDGEIKERGKHGELLEKKSLYYNLYNSQAQKGIPEEEEDAAEEEEAKKPEDTNQSTSVRKRTGSGEADLMKQVINEEKEEVKVEEENKKKINWKVMFTYNKQFMGVLALGSAVSLISGFHFPVLGYLFGRISIDVMNIDMSIMRKDVNYDFYMTLIVAGIATVLSFFTIYIFGYVSAHISYAFRQKIYSKIMSMQMSWFDREKNSASKLNSIMFDDTAKINSFIDLSMKFYLMFVTDIGAGLVVSFIANWKITLVLLVILFLNVFFGAIDIKYTMGVSTEADKFLKDSLDIMGETVKNYRTVVSFAAEQKVLRMHQKSLDTPIRVEKKRAILGGVLVSLSQFFQVVMYGAIMYVAIKWVLKGQIESAGNDPQKVLDIIRRFFICLFTIILSGYFLGQMQFFAPDTGKAQQGVINVFSILNSDSKIDPSSETGSKEVVKGRIEFKKVSFKYPGRNQWVLNNFNMVIEPGQRIGIVGASGSGKSTIIQLLERFYDINEGEILIDGINIKNYNLSYLRTKMSLVSQEPILFDDTILENIRYGNSEATIDEIKEAAKKADALYFIENDKFEFVSQAKTDYDSGKGFERKVGSKGTQISGGQKQRIAIARAIIRNPAILLLDEATSALDAQTETVVQNALNTVMEGRTSVVVAHRISTIDKCDCIYVLDNGQIVEQGKHDGLMEKKGIYYKLVSGTSKK